MCKRDKELSDGAAAFHPSLIHSFTLFTGTPHPQRISTQRPPSSSRDLPPPPRLVRLVRRINRPRRPLPRPSTKPTQRSTVWGRTTRNSRENCKVGEIFFLLSTLGYYLRPECQSSDPAPCSVKEQGIFFFSPDPERLGTAILSSTGLYICKWCS